MHQMAVAVGGRAGFGVVCAWARHEFAALDRRPAAMRRCLGTRLKHGGAVRCAGWSVASPISTLKLILS
jgi:hypothetical protein